MKAGESMDINNRIDEYKAIIDVRRPFEGDMLEQIKKYYRIGLTWSSNAIEGNTLTESETKVLLEDGLTAGGKPLRDTLEVLGHAKAYDFMFTLLHNNTITESDVLMLHRLFYQGVEGEHAGRYREMDVFITGSHYPVTPPSQIKTEMEALFEWSFRERPRYHPVVFAAQLHKRLVFIHPFKDGNGRVARLAMNAVLIQTGYLPAIIPPVLRQEYISLLETAHTNDKPFVEFIAERVLQSYREVTRLLQLSQ